MNIVCPSCKKIVPPDLLNVNTDLGKCGHCNTIFKLSEAINTEDLAGIIYPPFGSCITLEKLNDGTISIQLPVKKFSSSDLYQIFTLIFMVGFITVWTVGTASVSIYFALFSTPFWIVVIRMFIGLINSFDEDQEIIINSDKIVINKNKPIGSKHHELDLRQIYSVNMDHIVPRNPFSMAANMRNYKMGKIGLNVPQINSGSSSTIIFEYATEAEKSWIVKFLNMIIKKHKVQSNKK